MLSDEEKKEYEELKSLLYQGTLTQYGKRKLIGIIKKQSKELEELKEDSCCMTNCLRRDKEKLFLEDKIKAKIEELEKMNIHEFETMNVLEVLQSLLEKE